MLDNKICIKKDKLIYLIIAIPFLMAGYFKTSDTAVESEMQVSEWKAPSAVDKLVNPIKDISSAIEFGKSTFSAQCAVCHGNSGEGDGVAGIGLNPRPANFTSDEFQNQTDGAIFWKITSGKPPMASYSEVYSAKQRWQLVTFLRTFGSK